MLKGLTTAPKPCLSKILIEDVTTKNFNVSNTQPGYIDLYTDLPDFASQPLPIVNTGFVSLTFSFYLKSIYDHKSLPLIKENLLNSFLGVKKFTNPTEFTDFMTLSEVNKKTFLEKKDYYPSYSVFDSATTPLEKYVYDETYLSIPFQFTLVPQIQDETFLAYVFWLNAGSIPLPAVMNAVNVLPNTLVAEVVFENGLPTTQSGYFTISDTFGYQGKEHALLETTAFVDVKEKDPLTGEPVGSVKPTDLSAEVNMYYGPPGAVWLGPIHMHQYFDADSPNSGKYRAMGGAQHDMNSPHPYLDYNIIANNKILDYRAVSEIENMFTYNTNMYEKILASSSKVLHTSIKKKDTIDELVGDKAIFSEVNYSIRPTSRVIPGKTQFPERFPSAANTQFLTGEQQTHRDNIVVKDNIHFFFAIDKLKLIKETTALPGLLDKLTFFSIPATQNIVDSLEIFHFEVIRINKTTQKQVSLIVGDNDDYFDDYDKYNHLGKNISKGFQMTNKTDDIKTGDTGYISFYEFTDGEIDASQYDNNTYTYRVNLKFKDPVAEYLAARMSQARAVINDLDDLFHKTQLQIYDISKNRFVPVFDGDQNLLNSQFVEESLNPPANPKLPLGFDFTEEEIPFSVDMAFGTLADITDGGPSVDNLTVLLLSLNNYDDLIPVANMYTPGVSYIVQFIRNSLRLSTTNPSLILKVRSLAALIEDRLTKALLLYTTENITKKTSSFAYKDYLKSTNAKEAKNFVIETSYTFKEDISLSTSKNYINWIFRPNHRGAEPSGLKAISVSDYTSLMTTSRELLLSPSGKEQFLNSHYSYSFLPIMPAWINLFNNTIPGFTLKTYKLIKKKLFDLITNNPDSVVTPEILSYYGIRFSNDSVTNIFRESNTLPAQRNIGSDTFDPIGTEYSPFSAVMSKKINVPASYSHAFGSVVNSSYEWQGGSFASYPLIMARALINILNSRNQEQPIDSTFLYEKHYQKLADELTDDPTAPISIDTLFSNKEVPFEVNLFSTPNVALAYQGEFENSYVESHWLESLFNSSGYLNYDEYIMYALLLGLFGKVFYLGGFEEGEASDQLTPTSAVNRKLIRSMNWVPLTKQILDELAFVPAKQLYCKIELFEGEENKNLFDQRIINLFKQCFTYNKYFYIQSSSPTFSIANIPTFDPTRVIPVDLDKELLKDRVTTEGMGIQRAPTPNDIAEDRARRAAERAPDESGLPPVHAADDLLERMHKRQRAAKDAIAKLPNTAMTPYDDK